MDAYSRSNTTDLDSNNNNNNKNVPVELSEKLQQDLTNWLKSLSDFCEIFFDIIIAAIYLLRNPSGDFKQKLTNKTNQYLKQWLENNQDFYSNIVKNVVKRFYTEVLDVSRLANNDEKNEKFQQLVFKSFHKKIIIINIRKIQIPRPVFPNPINKNEVCITLFFYEQNDASEAYMIQKDYVDLDIAIEKQLSINNRKVEKIFQWCNLSISVNTTIKKIWKNKGEYVIGDTFKLNGILKKKKLVDLFRQVIEGSNDRNVINIKEYIQVKEIKKKRKFKKNGKKSGKINKKK